MIKVKKLLSTLFICILIINIIMFFSCKKNKNDNKIFQGYKDIDGNFSYFQQFELADTVYYIDFSKRSASSTASERLILESLNGILAKQNKVSIFIGADNSNNKWISRIEKNYKINFVRWTDTTISLVKKFVDEGYITGDYVLCRLKSTSLNVATTVAGVENLLLVSYEYKMTANNAGLNEWKGYDCINSSETEVFETYKDKLNKNILFSQSYDKVELRDYAIANCAMIYFDTNSMSSKDLECQIMTWASDDIAIMGWTEHESVYVANNSENSKITIPSDWNSNLTFFSCTANLVKESNNGTNITQFKSNTSSVSPQNGKHYITIVMSDGDNVQWAERGFYAEGHYGSSLRGNFPINWTLSPSMADLAPAMIDSIYKDGTQNDYFITGPSGTGYINSTIYSNLKVYSKRCAEYMKKSDMEIVTLLDNPTESVNIGSSEKPIYDVRPDKNILKYYSSQKNIYGGLWMLGHCYKQAAGDLYWSDNKPFVAFRDALWNDNDDNSETVARRVNYYAKNCSNYKRIEGYTAIVAHAWSVGNMNSINHFIESLDDNIEIVNAKQFLELISNNVEKKDVMQLEGLRYDEGGFNYDGIDYDYLNFGSVWGQFPIASSQTEWNFSNSSLNGWKTFVMGKEFDSVTISEDCIVLDGSDIGESNNDANSLIYNKIKLPDKENLYLSIDMIGKRQVNLRIRLFYMNNNEPEKTIVLNTTSIEEEKRQWVNVDVSDYKNKDVIIVIEQDDVGSGENQRIFIYRILISDSIKQDLL